MRPRNRTSPDRRSSSRPSPSRRSRMSNHQQPSPGMGPPMGPGMGPPPPMGGPYPPHPQFIGGGTLPHPGHNRSHSRARSRNLSPGGYNGDGDDPTPICRCRVLYLGSAVPHVTKDGLQGIQEPLKELYPEDGAQGAKGIDSWLSVWSNGFLLENVDENRKKVTRFFPVESLHYCAAVRYVLVPGSNPAGQPGSGPDRGQQRFLPLDSPFARNPNANHPPLFAAILRRTTGIKVLECHVFICKRETAANALVRCAFHAYADSTYAKHLDSGGAPNGAPSLYGTIGAPTPIPMATPTPAGNAHPNMHLQNGNGTSTTSVLEVSEDSINSIEKVEEWKVLANGRNGQNGQQGLLMQANRMNGGLTSTPRENGNRTSPDEDEADTMENHKVWTGKTPEPPTGANPENIYDYGSTLRSFRSSASGLSHRNRPRQMMMPSSPPPPPIAEELQSTMVSNGGERAKQRKKRRSKSRDTVDAASGGEMMASTFLSNGDVPTNGRASVASAPASRNGRRSRAAMAAAAMGEGGGPPGGPPNMRMMNGRDGRGLPPPHPGHPHHMMMHGPPPPNLKKSGTFAARGSKGSRGGMPPPFMMMPPGPYGGPPGPPPHLMPPPGHPLHYAHHQEEPIYMPQNTRPLSPMASYQPGHFPHEAYYSQHPPPAPPQQYATIDKANKYRKNHSAKGSKSSKANSKNVSSDSNADDSEFGAGIYKRGHINERAFSYSIRNEHRSRSYGSLANIQFGPNGEPVMMNGGGHHNGGEDLTHMINEMDIADDRLERSEVPPGLYPPHGHGHGHGGPPNWYGGPQMGGLPPMMAPPHEMDGRILAAGNGTGRRKKKW